MRYLMAYFPLMRYAAAYSPLLVPLTALFLCLACAPAPRSSRLVVAQKRYTLSVKENAAGRIVVTVPPTVGSLVAVELSKAMLNQGYIVINGRRYILVLEDVERNPLAPTRPAGD